MEDRHESQETSGPSQGTTGLGLGLEVNLRLGELTNVVNQLTDVLNHTGEKTADMFASFIQKIKDAGVGELKGAKERESSEGRRGEATDLYDRIVGQLQSAARSGEDAARSLLNDLGEKVESAGQKTQEFAQPSEEKEGFENR